MNLLLSICVAKPSKWLKRQTFDYTVDVNKIKIDEFYKRIDFIWRCSIPVSSIAFSRAVPSRAVHSLPSFDKTKHSTNV